MALQYIFTSSLSAFSSSETLRNCFDIGRHLRQCYNFPPGSRSLVFKQPNCTVGDEEMEDLRTIELIDIVQIRLILTTLFISRLVRLLHNSYMSNLRNRRHTVKPGSNK